MAFGCKPKYYDFLHYLLSEGEVKYIYAVGGLQYIYTVPEGKIAYIIYAGCTFNSIVSRMENNYFLRVYDDAGNIVGYLGYGLYCCDVTLGKNITISSVGTNNIYPLKEGYKIYTYANYSWLVVVELPK